MWLAPANCVSALTQDHCILVAESCFMCTSHFLRKMLIQESIVNEINFDCFIKFILKLYEYVAANNTIVLVQFGVTTLIHTKAPVLLPNIVFVHIRTQAQHSREKSQQKS